MSAKPGQNRKASSHSRKGSKRHRNRAALPAKKKGIWSIFQSGKNRNTEKKQSSKPITGYRLWLFRIIVIVVFPALLFLPYRKKQVYRTCYIFVREKIWLLELLCSKEGLFYSRYYVEKPRVRTYLSLVYKRR